MENIKKGAAKVLVITIILLVIIGVSLFAYFKYRPSGGTTNTGNTGQHSNAITMMNFQFVPSATTVAVGTTVTWTNNDTTSHQVMSDSTSGEYPLFESAVLAPGSSFSYTLSAAGQYPYHCNIHHYMTGTINVQ